WVGVVLIATCGIFLDGAALFPGPWAFWPLAGLILVLISAGPDGGNHDPKGSATHFLSNKPLAWIGDRAYGLYLWHWPLLIYYLEFRDRDAIGIRGAPVILAATTVLAMLMYRYIEQPIQQRHTRRQPKTAQRDNKINISATALGLVVAGTGATLVLNKPEDQVVDVFDDWNWDTYPGAMSTTDQYDDAMATNDPLPAIEDLPNNRPEVYQQGCIQGLGNGPGLDKIKVCEDLDKPDDPTATVAISGGCHSVHWYGAYKALADEYNWELLVVNKDACVLKDTSAASTDDCAAWNANYIKWLENHDVDLVVANGSRIL